MSLRSQLFLLQLLIVLVIVLVAGSVAVRMQEQQIRDAYQSRMVGVARSIAQLPSIIDAFDDEDPSAVIQPIAELTTQATGVTYVVVTDDVGIRYSHPNPAMIGQMVSTDPSVPLSGETYIGTQTGTLGESWRVKVPIWSDEGTVIGTASVGTLESTLAADLQEDLPVLLGWLVLAALAGTAGSIWISRLIWRRIYRLEPEEIAALLETRDAMIHGIGEGVVAVDERGRIAVLNDEAKRLLDVGDEVRGRPAADVLDPSLAGMFGAAGDTDETVLVGERVLLARSSDAVVDSRRVGAVLILRDRTELHQLLLDLDGARDVTQALRSQAHEFANKMHVISGLLELGQTSQAVDFISRSGHGGSVVSGELSPGITDPDAASLLMAKSTICAEKGITLIVDAASTFHPDSTTDPVTVLGNLIDNATEAIGSNGTIHVLLTSDADGCCVVVSDDGPGIPDELRERIFSSGFSTKESPSTGSRGFGLALVERVARRRCGSVAVGQSVLGGAQVTVHLAPAQAPAAQAPGLSGTLSK
ncbi:two-component system CitB family sensor kinase [Arthrobacter pigmenti]|uniref:histidine kinase n=1 Tax=Arthrobacter pigmenti TaxID=271432 RepID=A0A846RWV7_9MICC|nr:sensor histidine kinase [Arthrobacter pigmenti]NJC24075.1 two-component system CitB family sensor kinase [Arthrobacter pigmenti]